MVLLSIFQSLPQNQNFIFSYLAINYYPTIFYQVKFAPHYIPNRVKYSRMGAVLILFSMIGLGKYQSPKIREKALKGSNDW